MMHRISLPKFDVRALRPAVASMALAFAIVAAGCGDNAPKAPPPQPPKVVVAKPQVMPVKQYIEFTGNTAASETVELRARVQGFLQRASFVDGGPVKKGDVLFVIDQRQFKAAVADAEAEVANQQSKLARARIEFTRAEKLFGEKAGPQNEVVRWQNERDSAQAGIASAKAKLELAKLNLGYTQVTAPFDGRVGRRFVDPGNLVGSGQNTLLATVVRISPMYVYFNLNERDLDAFRNAMGAKGIAGAPVELGVAQGTGYPIAGKLDFADVTLAPQSGTLLLRAVFPNADGGLLPGMFVRLRIPLGVHETAITVPEEALGLDQAGRYVLVVNEKNGVERRAIQLGTILNGRAEVLSGLGQDDRLVVGGLLRARPGDVVDPVSPGAPGMPGGPGAQAGGAQAKQGGSAPADGKSPDKPADSKPVDSKPTDSKPAESKSADSPTGDAKPAKQGN